MTAAHRAISGNSPQGTARHGFAALEGITVAPLPGAACTDNPDPDDWFPPGTNGASIRAYRRARRVCAGCPAIAACLERALGRGETHGMFGGLTAHERRGIHGMQRHARTALIDGMTELEGLGADVDPVIDVIAKHRAREVA